MKNSILRKRKINEIVPKHILKNADNILMTKKSINVYGEVEENYS